MNDKARPVSLVLGHSALVTRPWPFIHRVDPRLRVVTAVGFSVVAAVADGFWAPAIALAVAAAAVVLAGLWPLGVLKRLVPFNVLVLLLFGLLPMTTPGAPVCSLYGMAFSAEGLRLAAAIALKGNAIVLVLMVLLGTLDITVLGHALSHLRLPDKLVHLLLFTVRYLDVLEREHRRLAAAMRVRGFRPRMGRHTYRSYGYLVGMLLLRSLDRSERVMAAMRCRGFRGRFYLLDHFALSRYDVPFALASLVALVVLVWVQWA